MLVPVRSRPCRGIRAWTAGARAGPARRPPPRPAGRNSCTEDCMDKVLVMGIGNLLLTDDGVGVHAAQTLAGESWPENITIMEAGTFTQDVFYLFKGFAHVLILDIVHGHAGPGTVYRLSESQLVDNEKQRLSIHDIDLLDSLRMAEMLHGSRPRLTVMEPADYTSWSMELSPAVRERFPAYLDEVRREILRLSRQYAGNDPGTTC